MAESRIIGSVKTRENKDSQEHEIRYFVLEADLPDYWPERGDIADWAPVSDDGLPAYVDNMEKEELAPGAYIVTIVAKPTSGGGGGGLNSGNPSDQWERRYRVTEIFFPMEWWGIHKATKAEAGWIDSAGNSSTTREETNAHQNISGGWAQENDYIFDNSSRLLAGTADYTKSPFLAPSIPLDYIEQKPKTYLYSYSYNVKTNINTISGSTFTGTNTAASFPKHLAPFTTTANKWRVADQELSELKDRKGNIWTHIERKLEYAPIGLAFDPDKHGGTF